MPFPSCLLLVTLLKLNCIVVLSEFLFEFWFLEFDFGTSRFFTDPMKDVALFFLYLDVLLGCLSIDYRLKTVWSWDYFVASWDFLLLYCFFRADEYVSTFPLAAYDSIIYGIACLEVPYIPPLSVLPSPLPSPYKYVLNIFISLLLYFLTILPLLNDLLLLNDLSSFLSIVWSFLNKCCHSVWFLIVFYRFWICANMTL